MKHEEIDQVREIAREVFRQELASLAPADIPVYRIMARRRADMGYTQADVAEKLGFALATIGAWETGRMPMEAAELYAEFLGLRILVVEAEPGAGPPLVSQESREEPARARGR